MSTETKGNLVTKLIRVMADITGVEKAGRNDFHKYSYVTEADVLQAVRTQLVKQNVLILSSVEGSHKDGDLTTIKMKHTIIDGDSGEEREVFSLGQGVDKSGDKGSNKAITSAMKYMLLKLFLISTSGDDVEATDETGKSTAPAKSAPAKKYGFSDRAKPAALAVAKEVNANSEF